MANEPRFEIYPRLGTIPESTQRKAGMVPGSSGFGWRFRDGNGRITFVGGEGFTRREDAHRAIHGAIADVHRASTEMAVMRQDVPIVDLDE